MGVMASPVIGPAGNVEFLVRARAHAGGAAVVGTPASAERGRSGGPAATGDGGGGFDAARVDPMIERALAESPRTGAEGGS